MKSTQTQFTISLPDWLHTDLKSAESQMPDCLERMRFVIDLSRKNAQRNTGGPFAAAVFDNKHNLISAAVNVVVPSACSSAHAEVMALTLAQKRIGCYDLNSVKDLSFELVTSAEPCAMCFGAVQWSGVKALTCGATSEDAEKIGFDEGAKPSDWVGELDRRGIKVTREVCRLEAAEVLINYANIGGSIYNPD